MDTPLSEYTCRPERETVPLRGESSGAARLPAPGVGERSDAPKTLTKHSGSDDVLVPEWLDPSLFVQATQTMSTDDVQRALASDHPTASEFAALISPAAESSLEEMAQRAQSITRQHFGRTISLYVPLYLSSFCPSGCLYCGFASDREQPRHRLEKEEVVAELAEIHAMGFDEVLLLTGERCKEAGFDYLLEGVRLAAERFHRVTIEAFAMTEDEYRQLAETGCTGITLYQETYDPDLYKRLHRWGRKRDYAFRLESPARALDGGICTVGIGALLGLGDPHFDAIALFNHLRHLEKHFWQGGFSVSFPRIRPQAGGYKAEFPVSDRFLTQLICAFRVCLPDVPLVLSTRETPKFRDNMAGIGISKMSIASRTTVGGYHDHAERSGGQFSVSDTRDVDTFLAALEKKGLQPVFKNWDSTLRVMPQDGR